MDQIVRPFRSVLYIPASRERALEKARSLPADAIIFDLEDAVAPDEKLAARETLAEALKEGGYGNRFLIVRVNGLDTVWGADDLKALGDLTFDAFLAPKVSSAKDVSALSERAGGKPIWAMIETARGVLNASEIADHPAMSGFVMGTNDLAKELNARSRSAMFTSLQIALLAARSAAIPCIDGVYNAFKDEDGLRQECEEGRDFGMDGKTLIHPAQLAIANEVFRPSEAEIDTAERQIGAFKEAEAAGSGVAVVDGRIVENLHVDMARALMAKAEAIAAMEG